MNSGVVIKKIVDFIVQPEVVMWGLVILIPLISKFKAGINYISVVDIIKNHLKCFQNNEGKYLVVPVINYVILPFIMGAATVQIKVIDATTIEIVTVIVSILTAMLFTMLTMVIDMKGKIKQDPSYFSTEARISEQSLLQTYYTIMFEILVSIVLLILCLFSNFTNGFGWIKSFLIYSFVYMLLINLLMIIKRIFRVIDNDMQK